MKLKTVALTGVMSLAGLGLVGAGTHATFTAQTSSQQAISAGTLSVVLNGPAGTNWTGSGTPDMTLPSVGPVGSTFISPAQLITITNNGSLTANEINLQVTDSPGNSAGSALAKEMSLCLYSDNYIVFNGLLSADEALGNMAVTGSIAPGLTDTYTAVFYAGDEDTECGNVSGYQYNTVDAVGGGNPLTPYPVTSAQPDAGSPVGYSNLAPTLKSDAEGGTDTVSVTLTYSA
jgi:predicted ribosomally synthesized peptide with SipW-like signal peptide